MSIEDKTLDAIEPVFIPSRCCRRGNTADIPLPVLFREGECCNRLSGRNFRQQSLLLLVRAGFQNGCRGQNRRSEIRRAEEGASHLLDRNRQLADAEPLTSVGLGNVDTRKPEVSAQTLPNLGVTALLGRHQSPDLGRRRPVMQEAAQHRSEFLLLIREAEFHGRYSSAARELRPPA